MSTTLLPPCHFDHFQNKKMLINQFVKLYVFTVPMTMTLQLVSIHCGKMSFLLLGSQCLGELNLEIFNKLLI